MGCDVLAVPSAQCLHGAGTAGLSIRETGRFTSTRVRRTIRNRWQVLFKLYQAKTLIRFAPALAAFEVLQFAGAVYRGWLGHWLWAFGTQIASFPDLLRRRVAFQRTRRREDLDVLVGGAFPVNTRLLQGGVERAVQRSFDTIADWNWRAARGNRWDG
jgi:hypothetical protein